MRLIRVAAVAVEDRVDADVARGVFVVVLFGVRTVVLRDFDVAVAVLTVETRDGADERGIFAVLTT